MTALNTAAFYDLSDVEKTYYNLNEVEKNGILKNIRKDIRSNGSQLLIEMMAIVDEEVMHYVEDFFLYDLEILNNSDCTFLWLVRTKGTFLINLNAEEFYANGEWIPKNFTHNILQQMKVEKYYVIEKGKELKKINRSSTLAILTIFEDIAISNQKVKSGAW
ncbi:hypothetical protein ACQKEY_22605 [Lysinibacillus fusiformis]|uniref:hypothetical protein n=1 Tax=Lysinibacillus fusiformis TaxID=28031 RepID=UPI003CFE9650